MMKPQFGFQPSVSNSKRRSSVTIALIVLTIVVNCSITAPTPQIDMCNFKNYTVDKFEIMVSGSDSLNSGVCRCQLSRVKENVEFRIVLNNFSCPLNACPWRFQVIVDGCVKGQYCCNNNWKGQEITYFSHTEKVSFVSLQISQFADPPLDIGTVSISVRIEGEDQLSAGGAKLTCGINTDVTQNYNFAKCGRLPELRKEPESIVALKRRAADDMIDICKPTKLSQNPVTFVLKVEPTTDDFICSAKIPSVRVRNTYKYTLTEFTCAEPCTFRLMIIVGKCITHYFCCGTSWQEVTQMIENVEQDSYIRVFKFGMERVQLTFSLTVLVADSNGKSLPGVEMESGYQHNIFTEFCKMKACLKPTLAPAFEAPSGSVTIMPVGWSADQRGFGETPGVKTQLLNLIRSIRTVMRIPLIGLNIVVIGLKLAFG